MQLTLSIPASITTAGPQGNSSRQACIWSQGRTAADRHERQMQRRPHIMLLVEDAAEEVEEEEIGVEALPDGSAISQQAAQHNHLLGARLLGCIHQVDGPLHLHQTMLSRLQVIKTLSFPVKFHPAWKLHPPGLWSPALATGCVADSSGDEDCLQASCPYQHAWEGQQIRSRRECSVPSCQHPQTHWG